MGAQGWVIFAGPGDWRLGRVVDGRPLLLDEAIDAGDGPARAAERLGALLGRAGAAGAAGDADAPAADVLLWQHEHGLELFLLRDGHPVAWHALPAEAADVALVLAAHVLSGHAVVRVAARGVGAAVLDGVRR